MNATELLENLEEMFPDTDFFIQKTKTIDIFRSIATRSNTNNFVNNNKKKHVFTDQNDIPVVQYSGV